MGLLCKIQRFVLTVLYFLHVARTEVPEYCLQPLNTSDCGLSPVTVVTYWKPGSRCEIDTWRGCPTVNMFPDEFNCSSTCIFKPSTLSRECEATLNENKCSDVEETVYTFVNGICIPKKWRGCESLNKFTNQKECMETCSDAQWQGKLENLDVGELKDISELLDTVIQEHNSTETLAAADDTQESPEDSNTKENDDDKTDADSEEADGSDDHKKTEGDDESEEEEKTNDENDNEVQDLAAKETSENKEDSEVDITEESVVAA